MSNLCQKMNPYYLTLMISGAFTLTTLTFVYIYEKQMEQFRPGGKNSGMSCEFGFDHSNPFTVKDNVEQLQ